MRLVTEEFTVAKLSAQHKLVEESKTLASSDDVSEIKVPDTPVQAKVPSSVPTATPSSSYLPTADPPPPPLSQSIETRSSRQELSPSLDYLFRTPDGEKEPFRLFDISRSSVANDSPTQVVSSPPVNILGDSSPPAPDSVDSPLPPTLSLLPPPSPVSSLPRTPKVTFSDDTLGDSPSNVERVPPYEGPPRANQPFRIANNDGTWGTRVRVDARIKP